MENTALTALAYFSLAMTILSLWVKRSPWIWGAFLILAFALGSLAKIVQPVALVPVGALIVLHTLIKGDIKGLARAILVLSAAAISIGLSMHAFPGFKHWEVAPRLWLNFDKPFMGIFVLALGFPLIKDTRAFGQMLKTGLPLAIGGVLVMFTLAVYSDLIRFDPKLPTLFWVFAPINLIFVSIIQEAFWRGFLQNELLRAYGGRGMFPTTFAVLTTSLVFAGLHFYFVHNFTYAGFLFVASVIYGSIYQFTRSLEASILAHWLFNLSHFVLFTYPLSSSS